MSRFKFAPSSLKMLESVHIDLKMVMEKAKERSEIDFDISCGRRSLDDQYKLFLNGRSQLDGINHKSKHNYYPACAVDIYAYNVKYADYSVDKMKYLSEIIKGSAEALGVNIVWGGDWKDFIDMPHYELKGNRRNL